MAPKTKNAGPLIFQAILLQSGKTATGFEVPEKVVESLGAGKKPAVRVTINGYMYRSSIASMGGKFMVGVSAEHRGHAGVKGGDKVSVSIELDTQLREVPIPPDFKKALDKDAVARQFFETLSYSNKLRHVLSIDGAKTHETRQRRIEKAITMLREGRK